MPFENVKEAIKNQLIQKKINDVKNELFNDAQINILFKSSKAQEEVKQDNAKNYNQTQEPQADKTISE